MEALVFPHSIWPAAQPRASAMNLIDLSDRVAVVTGGASGLGLAAGERFIASGAMVELWV